MTIARVEAINTDSFAVSRSISSSGKERMATKIDIVKPIPARMPTPINCPQYVLLSNLTNLSLVIK